MQILYIEDNQLDADLTRRALARSAPGYSLEIVGTIATGLARLATPGFDLALIDVNLPDGDGTRVLAHIRKHSLPVATVIITGHDDEAAAVAALKAGADDYIVKRDDYLARLPATLADALSRSRGRMLRRARSLPVLAMGFDRVEQTQLLRQLERYAPQIMLEFAHDRADLLVRLGNQAGALPFEVVLLADDGLSLGGLDALKLLRQVYRLELPIVLVADQSSADLALRAIDLGAADYLVRHTGYMALLPAVLENCASQLHQARLVDALRQAQSELQSSYDSTLEGWARALDLRDHETEGHSRRVTAMSVQLAEQHGMSEGELVQMRRGALLHDIGKMGVPDAILLKPGPLSAEEWRVMKLHPQLAYDMLNQIAFLRPALDIPHCHHERWDGTGYPRGLLGAQIPLAARLFAVIDVWDAVTSDRPYRRAFGHDEAVAIIAQGAGSHFDAQVVELFLRTEPWR